MKKYESNKARKLLLASMLIPLAVSTLPIENVYAYDIPTLKVYELNGSPKLEWATEMLDSNILWKTNFDALNELPNMNTFGTGLGKQQIVNNGSESYIRLLDTLTKNEGNTYSYPATSSDRSTFSFFERKFIKNGTPLSISFDARSFGGTRNEIHAALGDNHTDRGINTHDLNGNKLIYGQTVNYKQPPNEIVVYNDKGQTPYLHDGSLLRIASSKQRNHDYGIIFYFWNDAKKVFVRDTGPYSVVQPNMNKNNPVVDIFYPNDDVLIMDNVTVPFAQRTIPNNNEWHKVSINNLLQSDYFNFLTNGFYFSMTWLTDGILDIDNLKLGYATEVEVFRDGKSVYRGFLSDFHDTSIRDNVAPNKITSFNLSLKNNKELAFDWDKPNDNGITTNYTIQSIDKNGNRSSLSVPKPVTLIKDVQKYKYLISKKPQDTPTIETTANEFNYSINKLDLVNDYLHIQAIDSNGNTSEVSSFKVMDIIEDEDSSEINNAIKEYQQKNTTLLLLEQGELSLQTKGIKSFGQIKLKPEKQTVTTGFEGDFGVIDARGTQQGWKVNITATPFTESTFDGFLGVPHELPTGSLTLYRPSSMERVGKTHRMDGLPTSEIENYVTIDNGSAITMLSAKKGEGMGQFLFNFDSNALALTVDAKQQRLIIKIILVVLHHIVQQLHGI